MELTTVKDGIGYLLYAAGEYRIADADVNPQKSDSYFSHLEATLNQLTSKSFKQELDIFHQKISAALEDRHQYVCKQRNLIALVMGGSSAMFGVAAPFVNNYSPVCGIVLGGISTILLLAGAAGVAKVVGGYAPQKIAMKLIENARESNWQNVMRSREEKLREQIYRHYQNT